MTELIVKNTFFTHPPRSFPLTFIVLPFYNSSVKKQESNQPCLSQAVQVSNHFPAGEKALKPLA
jgi:hypothetical protein